MIGSVHDLANAIWFLRHDDKKIAIRNAQATLFWDNRLIVAYILLIKIYLEKGGCLEARNYLTSGRDTDRKNEEMLTLESLVNRCSIYLSTSI